MAKKHYVATVHLLVELDDETPGMEANETAACDAISEWLREAQPEIADWGYARIATGWTTPEPIELPTEWEEGDFYEYLPAHHLVAA